MINYNNIISIVQEVHDSECKPEVFAPAYDSFPFESVYAGQNKAIETIIEEDRTLLCSHTGSGKSVCFLTAAHELQQPTLVIEPRKFLQKQISEYFNDFVIYGKGEYPCWFAASAASAPCKAIFEKKGRKYFHLKDDCVKLVEMLYPCDGCEYHGAKQIAKNILLENRGVLITNFGNFWQYVRLAQFIIIDEADSFFQSISSGIELGYIYEQDIEANKTTKELLNIEIAYTEDDIESIKSKLTIDMEDSIKLNQLEPKLQKLKFFLMNADVCFIYKQKSMICVEIEPDKTSVLLDRLFQGKKVCIVTATPSNFLGGEK